MWLLVALLLVLAFVTPYQHLTGSRFAVLNAGFIFLFVQYARLLASLQVSALRNLFWLKAALLPIAVILFFVVLNQFRIYIGPLRDQTLFAFDLSIPYGTYDLIFRQWIFFGSGTLVLTPFVMLKLYRSLLRQRQGRSGSAPVV
jgi:hypothetical protein